MIEYPSTKWGLEIQTVNVRFGFSSLLPAFVRVSDNVGGPAISDQELLFHSWETLRAERS